MIIIADLMSVVVDHGGDKSYFSYGSILSSPPRSTAPNIDLDVRFASQSITFYRILIIKSLQCLPASRLILVTF